MGMGTSLQDLSLGAGKMQLAVSDLDIVQLLAVLIDDGMMDPVT